jgi:hypothetical protein
LKNRIERNIVKLLAKKERKKEGRKEGSKNLPLDSRLKNGTTYIVSVLLGISKSSFGSGATTAFYLKCSSQLFG